MRCHEIPSGRTTHNGYGLFGLMAAKCAGLAFAPGLGLWLYPQSFALWGVCSIPRQTRLFMGSQWIYLTSLILPRDVGNINNEYVE